MPVLTNIPAALSAEAGKVLPVGPASQKERVKKEKKTEYETHNRHNYAYDLLLDAAKTSSQTIRSNIYVGDSEEFKGCHMVDSFP